jgi:protein involved in polysaccharide export with SLBB domain
MHRKTRTHVSLRFAIAAFAVLIFEVGGSNAQASAIAAGDLVEMTVFQEADMTTKTRVSPNGAITIPFVGAITVAGASADEAATAIRNRLMKGYFVNPQVTVTVLEFGKKQITVIGQVQKGGTFDIPDGKSSVDLLGAIGMAGGYSRIADPRKITVKRMRNGKEAVTYVDGRAVAEGKAPNITILPGDAITVGESMF